MTKKIKRLSIILTTSKTKKDKDKTKNLGAFDFITKPTKFPDFIKAISNSLQKAWKDVSN